MAPAVTRRRGGTRAVATRIGAAAVHIDLGDPVVDTWGYTDSAPVGGTRTTVAPFSWFGVPNGSTVYAAVAGDEIPASADGGTLWTRHYAPGS